MMRVFAGCHRFAATRAFSSHWEALAEFVPKSKRNEMLSGSFDISKRQSKAEAASPLPDIDWAQYESVLGKDVVGPMKAEYEATPATELDAEIASSVDQSKKRMNQLKAEVNRINEENKPIKAMAAKQLKVLGRSRTTENTTLEEVARRYPEIHKEVMQKLADEDYNTDFPAIDQSAIRLASIKKHWDSSKRGKLTEEKLNETVALMEDLSPPKPKEWADRSYADFSDESKTQLAAMAEKLDIELTDELIAEFDSASDPFSLTTEELAETDEGKLTLAMESEVKKGEFADRAILLFDRINHLRDTGVLVPNPDVVERIEASKGDNRIIRMTEDELEGRSAEELHALAESAAADEDYYRGLMYSYESKVLSGEIDPKVRGFITYSGRCNLLMQMVDNMITVQETGKRPQFAFFF